MSHQSDSNDPASLLSSSNITEPAAVRPHARIHAQRVTDEQERGGGASEGTPPSNTVTQVP